MALLTETTMHAGKVSRGVFVDTGGVFGIGLEIVPDSFVAANLRVANAESFNIADSATTQPDLGDMSISLFLYPLSTGTRRNICRKGDTVSPFQGFGLEQESDNTVIVRMDGGGAANDFVAANSILNINSWNHLVLTREAGNVVDGLKVYVNNVLTDTGADNAYNVTTSFLFNIGGAFGPSAGFNGYMMKFGFWKSRAITAPEVDELYNGGLGLLYSEISAPTKANNTVYCDMSEVSDGTSPVNRLDSSGNNNHMLDQNTTPSIEFII